MLWTEKWAACKDAGIRYIHSVEIYLTETLKEKVRDNYHTVLMARNMDGVRELNRLISKSCDAEHKNGDRIAQLIIQPYLNVEFEEADELSNTERGSGGFGHSGQ